jgi:hypothetical protein
MQFDVAFVRGAEPASGGVFWGLHPEPARDGSTKQVCLAIVVGPNRETTESAMVRFYRLVISPTPFGPHDSQSSHEIAKWPIDLEWNAPVRFQLRVKQGKLDGRRTKKRGWPRRRKASHNGNGYGGTVTLTDTVTNPGGMWHAQFATCAPDDGWTINEALGVRLRAPNSFVYPMTKLGTFGTTTTWLYIRQMTAFNLIPPGDWVAEAFFKAEVLGEGSTTV